MSRLVRLICAVGLVALPSLARSQTLIAHYPLAADALDATGNNDPISLVNAPFEAGGVYCNGIYPDTPAGCLVETPELTALDLTSFSISAQFKIPADHSQQCPVFTGGGGWRWMGVELDASREIFLYHSNGVRIATGVFITPDVWYRAFINYDGAMTTGRLYLDDVLIAGDTFVLSHGNDRDISTSNFGTGKTFRGHFRDLRVYDSAFVPTPVEGSTWGQIKSVFATTGS